MSHSVPRFVNFASSLGSVPDSAAQLVKTLVAHGDVGKNQARAALTTAASSSYGQLRLGSCHH